MEIKYLRTLATEILKTLNDINPNAMKEIFINLHMKHKRNIDCFFIVVV